MILSHRARLLLGTAGFAGALVMSGVSESEGQDATISVTASVPAVCSVNGGFEDLILFDFGQYIPGGSAAEADIEFNVSCTAPALVIVKLAPGNFEEEGSRRMQGGSDFLLYNLYQDQEYEEIFGDDSFGAPKQIDVFNGTPTIVPVYGLIDAGQTVPAGPYNDTVQVTLEVI